VLAQLFYVNNYYVVANGFDGQALGTGILWSLAVEEHFYLIFPFVYLLLRRHIPSRLHQMLVLGAACAIILIWRCILVYGFNSPVDRTYVATDTRIDSILFGCMLAVYGNPILDKDWSPSRWWLVFVPLGLVALAFSIVYRDPQFRETFRYTVQGIALLPLFFVAVRYHDWPIFKLLNLGWLRFLGVLSYSLYLVHQIILVILEQRVTWHPFVIGTVALGLAIVVATIMHYIIEKPSGRLRTRLFNM
jgi:peptidoglycan/LPS O-acetylase OafA/YrhL